MRGHTSSGLVQINNASEEPDPCAHQRQQDEQQRKTIRSDSGTSGSHPLYSSVDDVTDRGEQGSDRYSFHS